MCIRDSNQEVQMAVKSFGKGRGVYISGLPYSFKNSRILYRAVLWSASAEQELECWYSTNYNVEVHAYVKNNKYCVVNNTYTPQDTTVYRGDGSSFEPVSYTHLDVYKRQAYARAAKRLADEGVSGCKTVFDIAPAYLSAMSGEELRAHLL